MNKLRFCDLKEHFNEEVVFPEPLVPIILTTLSSVNFLI